MKKRTMAFGGLLMAVAMTAYSVSGTYAKYISKIDITDEARVAKWDFYAVGSGKDCTFNESTNSWTCKRIEKLDLFGSSYTFNGTEYVKSFDGDNVIAPGTKGEYQVNFGGAMEVRHDFKLDFSVEDGKEVSVTYDVNADGSLTIYDKDSETQGANTYNPITYTISLWDTDGKTYVNATGKLADIQKALADWNNNTTANNFAPGRLGMSATISWKWDDITRGTGLTDDQVNELDTYIGKNWSKWFPDVNGHGGLNDLGNEAVYTLSASATQIAENHSEKAN